MQDCVSSWKSALDHPELVDELLQAEVDAGYAAPVSGGLDALREQYQHTAVGKLGIAFSSTRKPRLVLDSSVSGLTDATSMPGRIFYPRIKDVLQCAPISHARERFCAFSLDVAQAHKRILLHPEDGGLLAFHHRGQLFRHKTKR